MAWIGFFKALQAHIAGDWGYVPNPTGGFMGFWWSAGPHGHPYLQLEERTLVAKVDVEDASLRRVIRDRWSSHLTKHLSHLGFVRPARLGNGKTMSVAVCNSYLRTGPDGLVDVDATVRFLREVTEALAALEPPPATATAEGRAQDPGA